MLVAAALYLVIALEAERPDRRRAVEAMCGALAGAASSIVSLRLAGFGPPGTVASNAT